MNDSKIIQVLKTFSKREIRLFSEFVASPFHNKNKNVIAFCRHLVKFYPKFKNTGLEKKEVYKAVFKTEKINEQRLRDLSSMTLALAEEFLALQNFGAQKMQKIYFLLDELNKRKIDSLHEMRMKQAKRELNLTEFRENFYHEEFLILDNELNFKNRIHFGDDKALEKFFSGKDKIKALTSYFLFEVLVSYTFWVSAGQKFKQTTSFAEVENALYQLKEKLVGENIIIELYLLTLKMLVTDEESYFLKLKEIVCNDYFTGVSGYELTGILVNLSNFCSERISSGEYRFSAHAVDIYQTLLKRNLYLQSGVMSHIFFTNVVVHSIYCKKTEWLTGFIKTYQKYLQPELKESTINYCYAHLNFYNKNYSEVLKHLSKSYTNSILRQLNIKAMQARVYYELNETESLVYLLDSYKHTLVNAKKIQQNIYDGQMQYIKNIKSLLKIAASYNQSAAKKLEAKIKTGKGIYREWLLEKIECLAKN